MIVEFTHVMDLCMAIVTWCNAVICFCRQNLVGFELAIGTTLLSISRLEKPTAAAAAIIVGLVGIHFNKILFTHNRFHGISQVFGHRIPIGLSNQLAGILHREFDFQILVPVGIDLQFAFTNPLGIKLDDTLYFKVVLDLEFFQSDPDCKKLVTSLGIEPDLALEIIYGFGLDPYNFLPVFIVRQKQAVIFRRPSFCAVCPVGSHQV